MMLRSTTTAAQAAAKASVLARFVAAALVVGAAGLVACGAANKTITPGVGGAAHDDAPKKDGTTLGGEEKNVDSAANNSIPDGAALVDAKYAINVEALGLTMCQGDINLKVNASIKRVNTAGLIEFPSGAINCSITGKIDLAQILGAVAAQSAGVKNPVTVEDNVIQLKRLGGGTYNPPRPLLPSFLAAEPDRLRRIDYHKTTTVTGIDGKSASGDVELKVLSVDDEYTAPKLNRTFKNVVHFTVTNTGFDGVDKVSNLLFDQMEFRIALDPVAIVSVAFTGTVADYLAAAASHPQASGVGAMLANLINGGALASGNPLGALFTLVAQGAVKLVTVNMTMDLTEQAGLDNQKNGSKDDVGAQVGGKAVSK